MANSQNQTQAHPPPSNAKSRAANSGRMWSNFLIDESIGDIGDAIFTVNVDARKNNGLEERGTEQYLSTLVSQKPKKFVAPRVFKAKAQYFRGRGRDRGRGGRGRGIGGGAGVEGESVADEAGGVGRGLGRERGHGGAIEGSDRGGISGCGRGFVRGRGADRGRGRGHNIGGFGTKDDWTCRNAVCRNRNFSWRTDCNRCGTLKVVQSAVNADGGGEGKMEVEEDVEMAMVVEAAEVDTDADIIAEQACDIFKL